MHRIFSGTVSYFLIGFDPKACGADIGMYTNQGRWLGSYSTESGIVYKLYALMAKSQWYNTLVELNSARLVRVEH